MKVSIRHMGISVFLFFMLFQSCLAYFCSWFQYFDEAIVVVLLVYSALSKTDTKNRIGMPINMEITLFCLTGIVSHIANSGIPTAAVLLAAFLSVKFLLYLRLVSQLNITKRDIATIYKVMIFIGGADTCVMSINWFSPDLYEFCFPYARQAVRLWIPTSEGIFTQLAMNAFFLMFLTLYFFVQYISFKKKKYLVGFGYFLIFMLSTLRMKTIAGFFGVLCMYQLLFNKNLGKKLRLTASLVTGILIFTAFAWDQIVFTYRQYFTTELGVSARMAMTQTSFQIAKDYFPLGVGFGKFGSSVSRTNYSEYYYRYGLTRIPGLEPGHAAAMLDVYWPSVLGETGVAGMMLYLFAFFDIIRTILRRARRTRQNPYGKEAFKDMVLGLLVFVESIFETMGETIYNSCLQFLIIGLCVGIAYRKSARKDRLYA